MSGPLVWDLGEGLTTPNRKKNQPITLWVINSRRMRSAGHAARMGEMRNAYKVLVGKYERRNHSEDLGVDGKILESILRK
jgi:hypothetical protein